MTVVDGSMSLDTDVRESNREQATAVGNPDYGDVNSFIGFKLRLAQEAVFRGFARAVDDPTLKPGRFTAMCFIAQKPGISQSDLGALIGRDKSTITPMISDMIVAGYVWREQMVEDRRSFHLYLTPAGEAILERQWAIACRHRAAVDAVVGEAEKVTFLAQLDRLIEAFS